MPNYFHSCNSMLSSTFFLLLFPLLIGLTLSISPNSPNSVPSGNVPKRKLKILVYSPTLSWSHAQYVGRIADTLQEAGHEVHFFKFLADQSLRHKNETRVVHRVHFMEPRPSAAHSIDITKSDMVTDSFVGQWPLLTVFNHPMQQFTPISTALCKEVIRNTELLGRLASEHFDVGIAEMYDGCSAAILHRAGVRSKVAVFAVPLMQMVARRFGIPTFASFVPNMMFSADEPLESSFFARFVNFFNEFYDWFWMDTQNDRAQEPVIREAFGPEFPSLRELVRNVSLAFVNSNPFFEMARPISSKVVHIGGLVDNNRGQKEHSLDQRSKHILDNAREGAVLLSFGSIADTKGMGGEMRGNILRAFARFPSVQFLWKLDSESRQNDSALFASVPNVHTFDWIRQSAVLKHPNLRAFITHCGQNSLSEASRAGVPVVGIPLFGDQLYNAVMARQKGMALQVDVRDLRTPNGEEVLATALRKILNDGQYRQNARLIRKKLALMPFSPEERLVRWVEFAAEFEELNELNLPGDEELNWVAYYSVDVLLFSVTLSCCLLWLAWRVAIFTMLTVSAGIRFGGDEKVKRQ